MGFEPRFISFSLKGLKRHTTVTLPDVEELRFSMAFEPFSGDYECRAISTILLNYYSN